MKYFIDWCNSHNQTQIDRWISEYQESGMIIFDNFGSKEFLILFMMKHLIY